MKKIAIVGTGISGLVSAYLLNRDHDIQVFEANDYIGGHTATVDVEVDGRSWAIDTGFIVFNDRTDGVSKMHGGIISEALFVVFKVRFSKE